jgi:ComF family protein
MKASALLKLWAPATLSWFFPEVCTICGRERATADDGFVGAQCRDQVRWIVPPYCQRCGMPFAGDLHTPFECTNCRELDLTFTYARSAVAARGPVLDAVHRYKYQRALWLEPFLAELLVRQAATTLREQAWDCIVPVPLHSTRQREREFNQAERLARRLSQATGIPLLPRALARVRPTRTQTLLSRAERSDNVRSAFVPRAGLELTDRNVVVVDDVFTTGSTTSACARALRQAGAREVCVWTVARGL